MQIFYISEINSQTITLTEEESKHCIRVLRMNEGDLIQVVDGKGNLYDCSIVDTNPKRCTVNIITKKNDFEKRSFYLHIAIAPTKSIDRFEWFLEKATEIGIDEITPMLCEHSERKVVNPERLERVLISAMKQSIKAILPKLNPLTPFESIIKNTNENNKLIAYCGDFDNPNAQDYIHKGESVIILIGPEGDFSPKELDMAINNGFITVGLSKSRLRTETAGLIATSIANLVNGM
jgi:16S rRNA (uracil1498-N3)-methyltransferase